eukprot:m.1001 g.1001  ORF g.1001 m.1001 type:complete len:65 (+) comp498_c0_seq1:2221-2415(+)
MVQIDPVGYLKTLAGRHWAEAGWLESAEILNRALFLIVLLQTAQARVCLHLLGTATRLAASLLR